MNFSGQEVLLVGNERLKVYIKSQFKVLTLNEI